MGGAERVVFSQERSREQLLEFERQVLQQASDALRERTAMQAGRMIKDGDRSIDRLIEIANWKSPRRRELIKANDPPL